MDTEYDLAVLAEHLADTFPAITELYLFGSRAHRTKSTRSDADLLVIASEFIKPQELREYSLENCEALDLFLVDGGKATSTQNESFIQFDNFRSLIAQLAAVKIWTRSDGREKASIEWRFKVSENAEFVPSIFPNHGELKPPNSSHSINAAELSVKELISGLTISQIWSVLVVIFVVLSGVAGAAYWAGSVFGSINSKEQETKAVIPAPEISSTSPKSRRT